MPRHPVKILVVDDSMTAAKRLQLSLERSGFQVDIARNGKAAWELADKELYDLVVTDEQMPSESGQELAIRLRRDKRYAKTPIVFLTASKAKLNVPFLENNLKVSAILEKPFNSEMVTHLVEKKLTRAADAALPP